MNMVGHDHVSVYFVAVIILCIIKPFIYQVAVFIVNKDIIPTEGGKG
jgi:hypothetical protein